MSLEISGLSHRYGTRIWAVRDFTLRVGEGEVLAMLGPSGSGKTTTLQLLAGMLVPNEGEIRLQGRILSRAGHAVPPEQRNIGLIFQDFALWPHMTVAQTVSFPLSMRRMPTSAQKERIRDLLALVHLEGFEHRYPHELSGGQRQRVAIARALAPHPGVVLLDEPMSNLDAQLRERMRAQISDALRHEGATAVYVTHDRLEAMAVADRVAILDGGRLVQVGTPEALYHRPDSAFAATFFGSAALVPSRVLSLDPAKGTVRLVTALGVETEAYTQMETVVPGQDGLWILRPEHLEVLEDGEAPKGHPTWLTRLDRATFCGSHWQLELRPATAPNLVLTCAHASRIQPGTIVRVKADPARAWFLAGDPATIGAAVPRTLGEPDPWELADQHR